MPTVRLSGYLNHPWPWSNVMRGRAIIHNSAWFTIKEKWSSSIGSFKQERYWFNKSNSIHRSREEFLGLSPTNTFGVSGVHRGSLFFEVWSIGHHLLQFYWIWLQLCLPLKHQKCSVDSNTFPTPPSTWWWVYNEWIFIFGWTIPLKYILL